MNRGHLLADAVETSRVLLARYFPGFTDANRTSQAPGLPNHFAWCLGHLALTMHRVAGMIDGGPLPGDAFVEGEQQIGILEAAKEAGVEFVVKVSGGRDIVGADAESVVGRGHHAVEEALRRGGFDWCILSPGLFMQNMLGQAASIKADGKIVQPYPGDLPMAFVDVRDTGAVGARILRDPAKHAGKIYSFTGAVTTFEAFAKDFTAVLGKPVAYVGVTIEQAEAAMRSRNMPDWLVAHLAAIARAGNKGAFSKENTQPIRDIVGRAPLTTRQFVEAYKGAFV
jgi:uncharacterized protein YbjT (DUF2867 family)